MAKPAQTPLNFGGIEPPFSSKDTSKISVLPVPYDLTTTYVAGTKNGPHAILEASTHMELYDEELGKETYQAGIYTHQPIPVTDKKPDDMLHMVSKKVASEMKPDTLMVTLGGEHSITLGIVRELVKLYPDLSVLQLDAHADLRETYEGTPYNHACVGRRISELCPLVQAGVRSMSKEGADFQRSSKVTTISDYEIKDNQNILKNAINALTDHVYLTIDLDVLDPAIMPSVGTPEPGGLNWMETIQFLKLLSVRKQIVSFDVVELCPQEGNIAPDFLAAKLIYRLMGYIAVSREWI